MGPEVCRHEKVRVSPASGSVPEPESVTAAPAATSWFSPASAAGAWFAGGVVVVPETEVENGPAPALLVARTR